MMLKIQDLNPGILIKHFNGIEQEIPMFAIGEEFTEILRINTSLDGKYLVIMGIKKTRSDDHFGEEI